MEYPTTTIGGVPVTARGLQRMNDLQSSMAMAGTFAGPEAKGADLSKLWDAMQGERAGHDPVTLWKNTGWFRGPDTAWRYEIPDTGATFKPGIVGPHPMGSNEPYVSAARWGYHTADFKNDPKVLGDVIDHPELFKAYPELAQTPVRSTGLGNMQGLLGAVYDDGSIGLSGQAPKDAMSTLMHEIQHKIQYTEDFARGGNKGEFLPEGFEADQSASRSLMEDMQRELRQGSSDDPMLPTRLNAVFDMLNGRPNSYWKTMPAAEHGTHLDTILAKARKILGPEDLDLYETNYNHLLDLDKQNRTAFQNYQSLAGEVESRLVEERLNNPAPDTFPLHTTGYPTTPQIVVYKGQKVALQPVDHDPFNQGAPNP